MEFLNKLVNIAKPTFCCLMLGCVQAHAVSNSDTVEINRAKKVIRNYEVHKLTINKEYHLNHNKKALIFRVIESNNNYRARTKRSSARGAYSFLKSTRRMLIKKMRGITYRNWHYKRHQDAMFRKYYKMQEREISKFTKPTMAKAYLSWQMGVGGLQKELKILNGKAKLDKKTYKSIIINMPNGETDRFRRYIYAKMVLLAVKHGIKIPKYKNKTSSLLNLKNYLKRRLGRRAYKMAITNIENNINSNLVKRHMNRYATKISKLVKKYC